MIYYAYITTRSTVYYVKCNHSAKSTAGNVVTYL